MPRTTLLRKQVTPVGSIQPHAGPTAPDGFLVCDGSIVNIADYPKLYAAIGTSWGHGNEISPGVSDGLTFHLPDLRGRTLRGQDQGAGRDPDAGARTASNAGGATGDAVGTVQGDTVKSGTFAVSSSSYESPNIKYSTAYKYTGIATNGFSGLYIVSQGSSVYAPNSMSVITGTSISGGGNETRPVNANVNYVIKAE